MLIPLQNHTEIISGQCVEVSLSAQPLHLSTQSLQSESQPAQVKTPLTYSIKYNNISQTLILCVMSTNHFLKHELCHKLFSNIIFLTHNAAHKAVILVMSVFHIPFRG